MVYFILLLVSNAVLPDKQYIQYQGDFNGTNFLTLRFHFLVCPFTHNGCKSCCVNGFLISLFPCFTFHFLVLELIHLRAN